MFVRQDFSIFGLTHQKWGCDTEFKKQVRRRDQSFESARNYRCARASDNHNRFDNATHDLPPAYHPNPHVRLPFLSVKSSQSSRVGSSPPSDECVESRNFAKSGILYDWPFIVCENIICVRATWLDPDADGTGEVSNSAIGTSLMPSMTCAGSSELCGIAPT